MKWGLTESSHWVVEKWLEIGGSAVRNGGVSGNECSKDNGYHWPQKLGHGEA